MLSRFLVNVSDFYLENEEEPETQEVTDMDIS